MVQHLTRMWCRSKNFVRHASPRRWTTSRTQFVPFFYCRGVLPTTATSSNHKAPSNSIVLNTFLARFVPLLLFPPCLSPLLSPFIEVYILTWLFQTIPLHSSAHKLVSVLETRLSAYEKEHSTAKVPQLYLLLVQGMAELAMASFFTNLMVNTPALQLAELSTWFCNAGFVPTYGQPSISLYRKYFWEEGA